MWWAGENTWYEGLASPSRDVENCWQVTYSNGQIENEFCHVVIFDTPTPAVHSEISLPADLSAESVCLSPILTKRRSNRSNVLAACDISDSDSSPDSPCLSARGSSITPLVEATRRISDSEISPGFPTCSPIVDSPDVPAAEVPASLSPTQVASDNCCDAKHVETTLDRDIDARMRIDFSPPEPRYRPASLEIRDCDLSDVTENERLNDLLPVWSIEGSVIPLDFEPTKRNVTQVLIDILK